MSDVVGAVSVNKIGYLLFYSRAQAPTPITKKSTSIF